MKFRYPLFPDNHIKGNSLENLLNMTIEITRYIRICHPEYSDEKVLECMNNILDELEKNGFYDDGKFSVSLEDYNGFGKV